jgi:formylglycine-generating enzyme required for sulfatase activity
MRVVRGGSYKDPLERCTPEGRGTDTAARTTYWIGVRPVRSLGRD